MADVARQIAISMALLAAAAVHAQAFQNSSDSSQVGNEGFGLYEVSVFSGYATSAYPLGSGQVINPKIGGLGSDVNYGANAILGWRRYRSKGGVSIRYSGAYTGLFHYSDANGYSQSLFLSAERKLSPRWDARLSVTGQDATLVQFLDEPSATKVISELPSDFNDFAAAFGLGSFGTAQAASTILGAPVLQPPLAALLLGDKVQSYDATVGIVYVYSPQLSFRASSFSSGGRGVLGTQNERPPANVVLPFSFGGSAGINWSYSPSPRTEVGVNLDVNRMENHFQASDGETAKAYFGRKMGMYWFLKTYGGITTTQLTEQTSGTPRSRQVIGGGVIGIKTYEESFVASYDRSASNNYGFVGSYTSLSGTWIWHHPGSQFRFFASFDQQQLRDTGFQDLSGWQVSAGFSDKLTAAGELRAQYVYFKSQGSYLGSATTLSLQSVRLSMSWSPEVFQR